jgi:hypothetical protein
MRLTFLGIALLLLACAILAATDSSKGQGSAHIWKVETSVMPYGKADLRSTQGESIYGEIKGFACDKSDCYVVTQ